MPDQERSDAAVSDREPGITPSGVHRTAWYLVLAVLAVLPAAVAVLLDGRAAALVLAGVLIVIGSMRAGLDPRSLGPLVVRRRVVDVAICLILALLLVVAAVLVPR